jgi:hypothetical protein
MWLSLPDMVHSTASTVGMWPYMTVQLLIMGRGIVYKKALYSCLVVLSRI